LEINPEAHFGLEKYHLALLQYLIRDPRYRLRHVYVDEFTQSFLIENGMHASTYPPLTLIVPQSIVAEQQRGAEELTASFESGRIISKNEIRAIGGTLSHAAFYDPGPSYRSKWDLGKDTNLEKGVIYMAGLNEKEPACWVMLGILGAKSRDKNLTIAAYERALRLGAPQAPILRAQIEGLREHINHARAHNPRIYNVAVPALMAIIVLLVARSFKRMLTLRAGKVSGPEHQSL
jgi:hypothetical protein